MTNIFKKKIGLGVLAAALSCNALAGDPVKGGVLLPSEVKKFAETISDKFNLPYKIKKIGDGSAFYRVTIGPNVLYVTPDGKYVIEGSLFDVKKGYDLTALARLDYAKDRLTNLSPEHFIEYKAKVKGDTIWVFSDANCPYCQKFHQGVPELNEKGVTVKYLAFPLQGPGSKTYNSYTGILCSKNPGKGFEDAIKNIYMENNPKCEPFLKEGVTVAGELGIQSTPTIVLPNGVVVSGSYSPEELLPIIEQAKSLKF